MTEKERKSFDKRFDNAFYYVTENLIRNHDAESNYERNVVPFTVAMFALQYAQGLRDDLPKIKKEE